MTDIDKIINGLTKARNYLDVQQRTYESVFHACDKPVNVNAFDESIAAIDEAIEMLKAQDKDINDILNDLHEELAENMRFQHILNADEPKILTDADFIDNPRCDINGNLPVWKESRTGMCGWVITSAETMYVGMYAWGRQKYRYWTSKPTEDRRRAVKWE